MSGGHYFPARVDGRAMREIADNSQLAFEILDYFRRHPEAKDSAEGIATWWVQEAPGRVRQVLDKLVESGLVGKRSGASIELYFAPNGDGKSG